MIVPWVVKNWAKWSGVRMPGEFTARSCWRRISAASIKARLSITTARQTYMMPMRLWSRLVNQTLQR